MLRGFAGDEEDRFREKSQSDQAEEAGQEHHFRCARAGQGLSGGSFLRPEPAFAPKDFANDREVIVERNHHTHQRRANDPRHDGVLGHRTDRRS